MVHREQLTDCQFKEGIYFEDTEWTPRMLIKAQRAASTDLMVYNYLFREGSITLSVDEAKKRKVLADKLLLVDSLKAQMQQVADKRWFEGMIAQTVISIIGYVAANYYDKRKEVMDALAKKDIFPLSSYQSNQTGKRKIAWANISPRLLCFMLHLKN